MSDTPLHTFNAFQNAAGRPKWTVELYGNRVVFSHRGRRETVQRSEATEQVELIDGLLLRRILAVAFDPKAPGDRTLFVLDAEAFQKLDRWIGPPTRKILARVLREKLSPYWTVPVGLLWAYLAFLPRRGDPSAASPDVQALVLGLTLFFLGIFSRLVQHRLLLLGYAGWFAAFSAYCVLDYLETSSLVSVVLAVVGIGLASSGLGQFYRFAVMADERVVHP
jgi:hypothetical protein